MAQCRTEPSRQLLGIIIRPEMHKEEPRAFGQHVIVQRSYFDPVIAQCPDHRVYFVSDENKVAGNSGFASFCGLKVDCCCYTHRGRDFAKLTVPYRADP
jgi:hypothetical protein